MDTVYIFCEHAVVRIPLFNYDKQLFSLLMEQGGAWDKSKNHFLFARDRAVNFGKILEGVPLVWVDENTSAQPKITGFLERQWENSANANKKEQQTVRKIQEIEKNSLKSITSLPEKFPEYWQVKLEAEMRSRKYSKHTIEAYIYFNRMLCRTMQKLPEEMQAEDIPFFLASIEKSKEYSAASVNLAISSIKYFYKRIMKNDIAAERKRPRQDKRLPIVLSKGEVDDTITAEKNIKHQLFLKVVYGCGLRVGEAVTLKPRNIDRRRKVLNVVQGKGRKDRQVVLPDTVIAMLDEYFRKYDISSWLFPGADPKQHLNIRTAQHIIKNALKRANIDKAASAHSFRHSFATHHLENGTAIRYIQESLGHSSIRTTERYTHVAQEKAVRIKSPLDTIKDRDD